MATGAIGAVAQVLPPVSGWAHVLCGVLLLVWLTGIAFALWALGSRHCATANGRLQKRENPRNRRLDSVQPSR